MTAGAGRTTLAKKPQPSATGRMAETHGKRIAHGKTDHETLSGKEVERASALDGLEAILHA